jgi:large subunit ribosomal protein L16
MKHIKLKQQVKFKKTRKGRLLKFEYKSNKLIFGTIGLKACESGIINTQQIEAARQVIVRKMKRKGKIWIRILPNILITTKPTGLRMGKGKGQVSHKGARIFGGTVIFEICGVPFSLVFSALKSGGTKLPIRTKIFT